MGRHEEEYQERDAAQVACDNDRRATDESHVSDRADDIEYDADADPQELLRRERPGVSEGVHRDDPEERERYRNDEKRPFREEGRKRYTEFLNHGCEAIGRTSTRTAFPVKGAGQVKTASTLDCPAISRMTVSEAASAVPVSSNTVATALTP